MSENDISPNSIAANPHIVSPLGSLNRGEDNKFTSQDAPPLTVTLEKVNDIILDYLRNRIAPVIDENGNEKVVTILYGTPERWATIRREGTLIRDPNDSKLQTPLIVLRRVREQRGQVKNPNNKYIYESLKENWNQRTAYSKFMVQNNIMPSQQIRQILIPDYMTLTYDVVMWASFQGQLDKLIEQINFEDEEFWGERNNFKFRVKIQDYTNTTQLPATQDRTVRTEFSMEIRAYLLPDKALINYKPQSTQKKTYTIKKVVIDVSIINDQGYTVSVSNPLVSLPITSSIPALLSIISSSTTNILAFWDVSTNLGVSGSSFVSLSDARGITGYAPPLFPTGSGKITYNNQRGILEFSAAQQTLLQCVTSSLFDMSVTQRAINPQPVWIAFIGSCINNNVSSIVEISTPNGLSYFILASDSQQNGNYACYSVNGLSGIAVSTTPSDNTIRCVIATELADFSNNDAGDRTIEVRNQGIQRSSPIFGFIYSTGSYNVTIGGVVGDNDTMTMRTVIIGSGQLSDVQRTAIGAYANSTDGFHNNMAINA